MSLVRQLAGRVTSFLYDLSFRWMTREKGRSKSLWFAHKAWDEILKKNWRDAVFFARVATTCDSTLPEGYLMLGLAYARAGHPARAREAYAQGARLAPEDPRFPAHLGELELSLHRIVEAEAAYQRAIELKPDEPGWLLNLASALRQQGRLDEAVALLETACQLAPNHARVFGALGAIRILQEDFGAAVEALSKATLHEPSLAQAHGDLAFALTRLDRWQQALEEARIAAELDPTSESLQQLLQAVKQGLEIYERQQDTS